jgi:phenylacetic acid degradation operon negative regulatory protein
MQSRHLPTVRPLSARSVALSALLGYHPPALPISSLIRIGELFEIPERTMRMALRRMVANGDVVADDGFYQLTGRLLERQALQDESCSPKTKSWRGSWEMAVVTAPPRPLADRVALRRSMVALRLAELREGVWLRPANLVREWHDTLLKQCTFYAARPEDDPLELAGSLWDLQAWASEARQLQSELAGATGLKEGFMVTADVLRHLLIDPMLPPELLPDNWPATELREQFAAFELDYATRLREYSDFQAAAG